MTDTPRYVARLAFNSQRWQRPSHANEVRESGESYRTEHGFGHEDWLFRNEWLLDGWRYGFVQGVNKSRKKLLASGKPFHLRLFTMPTLGSRRVVAEISDVECLPDAQAADAVSAYEEMGWLDTMRSEVTTAGGRAEALGQTEYAPYILNLRYRLEHVRWLEGDAPLPANDPIHRIKRYSLCSDARTVEEPIWRGRAGAVQLPSTAQRRRFIAGGWTWYSPEHVRMQAALMERLAKLLPGAEIICEQDHVDIVARTASEVILFEIKTDLSPLSVIRQALGQILEYAYHPRRIYDLPVRLVIVGRNPLASGDASYFESLRDRFNLPIEYWVMQI